MQRVFDGGRRWEAQEEEEFHFLPSCSGIGQAHTLQLLGKGNIRLRHRCSFCELPGRTFSHFPEMHRAKASLAMITEP